MKRKSVDAKTVDFLPMLEEVHGKNGLIFPPDLEGKELKRELKDGMRKKTFFIFSRWERKGAMNLVQDLSLDNLLSIQQLEVNMRKVKRKE